MAPTKGLQTREHALERARGLAARRGLDGVSLAELARECGLSKSGLYAHFDSKEALQLALVEHASAEFERSVIEPALGAARGVARVRELVHRWRAWSQRQHADSGCFFLQASVEFDDQDGAVREKLAEQQRRWIGFLTGAAQRAIETGDFSPKLDARLFAFELNGLYMAWHHATRMMRDDQADARFDRAFEGLLQRARAEAS